LYVGALVKKGNISGYKVLCIRTLWVNHCGSTGFASDLNPE